MGEFSIIEHLSDLFKFKLETQIPTGKVFGNFEKNREKLQIASYSVK